MTHRQLVALCSCPCSSRRVDPEPASRYCVVIPSTVTRRSWTTIGLCRSDVDPVWVGSETADIQPPGVRGWSRNRTASPGARATPLHRDRWPREPTTTAANYSMRRGRVRRLLVAGRPYVTAELVGSP